MYMLFPVGEKEMPSYMYVVIYTDPRHCILPGEQSRFCNLDFLIPLEETNRPGQNTFHHQLHDIQLFGKHIQYCLHISIPAQNYTHLLCADFFYHECMHAICTWIQIHPFSLVSPAQTHDSITQLPILDAKTHACTMFWDINVILHTFICTYL